MRLPLLFLCIVIKCTLPPDTAYSVGYSFVEGLNERILDYSLSVFFPITYIVAWFGRSVRREEVPQSVPETPRLAGGNGKWFISHILCFNFTLTYQFYPASKATYLSKKYYSSLVYRRGFPLPIHIGRFNRGEWSSPLHRSHQNHHYSYFRKRCHNSFFLLIFFFLKLASFFGKKKLSNLKNRKWIRNRFF